MCTFSKCVVLAWLILLVGCATPKPGPVVLDRNFSAINSQQVVLLEVSFLDPPLDPRLQDKAREAITERVLAELQAKGYQVIAQKAMPSKVWLFDPRDLMDMQAIAQTISSGPQAVVHVQIDHFLWGGFGDRRVSDSLEIYATAGLYEAGSGKELWRATGTGYSWVTGSDFGLYGPDLSLPSQTLAESLFETLPAVRCGDC